jgi:Bacterial antitoxin of type II TA system, VapB
MQQSITINDTLLENASKSVGLEDVNEVINLALHELITNHQTIGKRRQPPVSIANKGKILGDLIEPSVEIEDFECLK